MQEIEKMITVEQSLTFAKTGLYEKILDAIEIEQKKLDDVQQSPQLIPSNPFKQQTYQQSIEESKTKKIVDDFSGQGKVVRLASIFKQSVLEPESKKGRLNSESDLKTAMMRKSIFAYWSVFIDRFVDNLHLRILHNLLMCFD